MALTFWRRRRIEPMPRRDFAMTMGGGGDPLTAPLDDYRIESEEEPRRPSAAARIVQTLQIVLIIVIAVLSLAVFWLLGTLFNIL